MIAPIIIAEAGTYTIIIRAEGEFCRNRTARI